MFPPSHKSLVRPRSSLSTVDENRLKPGLKTGPQWCRPSLTVLSLIGICAFLFVLCVCLVCTLVVIGKNFARAGNGNDTAGYATSGAIIRLSAANDAASDRLGRDVDVTAEEGAFVVESLEVGAGKQTQILRIPKAVQPIDPEDLLDVTLLASGRYWPVLNSRQKVVYVPGKVPPFRVLSDSENSVEIAKHHPSSKSAAKGSTPAVMSKVIPKLTYRLPSFIKPRLYNLSLHPHLESKRFTGKVLIEVDIRKETSFIPVHAKKLNITGTNVFRVQKDGTNVPIKVLQAFAYDPHEYWVTEFEKPIEPALYHLNLTFEGSLTDRIVGLYQSSYFDKRSGKTRWIATSKFEPTFARQAFPCFDEPAMKAKFKVTLYHPNSDDYHALSNMDVVRTETVDEKTSRTVFSESVPMSTYLACFIVSDFVYESKGINAAFGKDFSMQVYAAPGQLEKATFALDTGVSVTEYYIRYFEIEYPLPKLDMVAIPDFVSGAMEHWGLVTFRETSLLYSPEISSAINKQRVGSVVAHELAHMWFGNLVTMKWWNDLWLNEGFATYITYKGLHQCYPEWDMLSQFVINDLQGVLSLDATLASHPVVQSAENPDQITELFDSITYSKGASVIRMLEHFVGEEIFRTGVINYLKKFSYSNAVTDDFLNEVAALVNNVDVKHVMETFTMQMGFPVVEVKKVSNTQYKLTQKRFFSNPEDEKGPHEESPFKYRWYIPITYFTNENPTEELKWFDSSDIELTIDVPASTKWVKFNKDQIGYYRVNYETEVWKDIAAALSADVDIMSTADRGHLLNDAYTLAGAKQLPFDVALEFMDYLQHEDQFVPWSVASSALLALRNRLRLVDYYGKYLTFAQGLIGDIYNSVGWVPDENHIQNRLRIVILETACSLGYQPCLDEAEKLFTEWLKDPSERPVPDIRTVVYAYGIAGITDEAVWEQVWQLFLDETDATEKAKLMSALAMSKLPFVLKRFVDLAWDENNIRSQDYFTCMQAIAANPVGEPIVWDYVRENWPRLVERFGLNERYLGRMIPSITGRFASQIKLDEIETFFAKYPEAGAGAAARRQAVENVRNNIQWLENNKDIIGQWLKNRLN